MYVLCYYCAQYVYYNCTIFLLCIVCMYSVITVHSMCIIIVLYYCMDIGLKNIFVLESVNILRKYISFLDIGLSCLTSK